MGYVLPGWLDEILDFIGINWPNVDEDDYREMADAMRELADAFDDHAGAAHGAVSRLLSSSEGMAVDALEEHWGKVKASHLEQLPEVARLFADAMDVVADVIYGMKVKAEIELGVMAASVGISVGLAFVTGGLSALIGAAQITAMREVVRRIIKEATDQIVDQVMAMVTEPVAAKLEEMVSDAILELATDALGSGDSAGGGGTSGTSAMNLNSAGGPGVGGGVGPGKSGNLRIDHDEYEKGAADLGRLSETSLTKMAGPLDRARSANGRTRGKDAFTASIDGVVDGATKGMKKAVQAVIKHTGETVPKNMRHTSTNHKRNERSNKDELDKILKGRDGKDGPNSPPRGGNRPGGRNGAAGTKPDLLNKALNDPRHHGIPLNFRKCKNDPIDVATGQMVLPQTDLSLPAVLPLVLKRTHLSDYTFGTWFGRSRASTLDERIEVDVRNKAVWAREDGSLLAYGQLPTPSQPEVLPLEGPRIPLRRTSEFGAQELEFAATDPDSGLTRYFARQHPQGWQLWLVAMEDRNGNQIDIHRDADGMPLSVTHSGGYDVRLTGDRELGRIRGLELRTPEGPEDSVQILDYRYDPAGDLIEVINSSGRPLQFGYDAAGRIVSWTDRNNSTFRYVYDAAGRAIQTIGPDGYLSSTFAYDAENRVTRYTDSLGATTVFHLNNRLQVIAESDPQRNTILRQWDRYDNLTSRTDELGNTAEFTWDEHSNLTSIRLPDGSESHAVYNAMNLPQEVTGFDGNTWRQSYDDRGNRTAVHAPDGSVSQFRYDAIGALISRTDPTGATEQLSNNGAGVPLAVTDALGHCYTVVRDAFARPLQGTDPHGAAASMQWTPEGWLSRSVGPDGSAESWTWDDEGNCTSHTDEAGATTRFEYTHFDRLAARIGADGARYEFTYDTELRLTQVRNPQGMNWIYTYDAAGNLVSETDFDGRTVTYAHDGAGRVTSRTTPLGEQITTSYDARGRLVAKDVAGDITHYTYGADGRLAGMISPASTVLFERDEVGRLLSETVDGRTMRYSYDPAGRVTSRTTPTGALSQFTYDAAGNRTGLSSGGHALAFTRDARGRELTRSFGQADRPITLTSAWDAAGRLASQVLATPGQTLRARGYGYRPDGCLERLSDQLSGTSKDFLLDSVGRPLQVNAENWTETYAYDEAGNQTQAEWPDRAQRGEGRGARTYAGTRLLTAGAIRCEYDAAGRTVMRQKSRLSRKPDTWRYSWDAENRLVACLTPDGTRWTYTYDPLGRRTAKHRTAGDGLTVLHSVYFTWDGTRLAEQSDTVNRVTLTWDYEGYRPLTQLERRASPDAAPQSDIDSRFFAIVTDLVGAPSELVDEDGQIAWHTRTTVWGTTSWNRGAVAYIPLRFPGQYDDAETNLYYNYFRHYDPETARYASPDPLGLGPSPNPVAYVTNPHTRMDPEGLIAKGCTENGGWWSGMKPANLKDANGNRRTTQDMEINHIPAKASYAHLGEPGFTNGAGMGPSIRMEYDDHRAVTSTGSGTESAEWRATQRELIDNGRWDEAMMMDIDETRDLYGAKYDTHIADMIESLKHNKKFQAMLESRGWTIDYDILK